MKKIFSQLNLILTLLVSFISVLISGCVFKLPKHVQADKNIEYVNVNWQSLKLDIYRPK